MVKLTPDVIEDARQFVNTVQDRELDLRGFKIPVIENLGATYNQFDTIDFTDNDIKRLENIPLMPRLKCLFFNNNRINFIEGDLSQTIPNLNTLVLTNNNIENLGDIDALAKFPKLEYLSLMGNPVTKKQHYRLYVIWKVPKVRVVDFRRIKLKEREAAKALFKGKKGEALQSELGVKSNTFNPGELANAPNGSTSTNGPTPSRTQEDAAQIKQAISGAKSLQEMERIQEMLEAGQIPGLDGGPKAKVARTEAMEADVEEEEEEEEEEESAPISEKEKQTEGNGTSEEPMVT